MRAIDLITTSGYLKGPGFKGLRRYLRRTCSERLGLLVRDAPDAWYAVVHVLRLAYGAWLLWTARGRRGIPEAAPPQLPELARRGARRQRASPRG